MKTFEDQFEQARREYLKQSFPGDLAEMLELNQLNSRPSAVREQSTDALPRDRIFPKVMWALAVLVLIGVAVGVFWLLNRGSAKPPIVRKESLTTPGKITAAKSVRAPRLLSLSQPVSLDGNRNLRSKSRFFSASRSSQARGKSSVSTSKNSVFVRASIKNRITKLWDSGVVRLALRPDLNVSTKMPNKFNGSTKNKVPRQRARFRSRIQFEPIRSYRRS